MRRLASLTALVVLCAFPAMAHASGQAVIDDCTDNGTIDGTYSAGDYRDALREIPTDIAEYTDCTAQIRAAQRSGSQDEGSSGGGTSGGGTSGGGAPFDGGFTDSGSVTTDPFSTAGGKGEEAAIAAAGKGGASPLPVGNGTVTPGATGLAAEAVANAVPTPVLVVLILLGAFMAATTLSGLQRRSPRVARVVESVRTRVGRSGNA